MPTESPEGTLTEEAPPKPGFLSKAASAVGEKAVVAKEKVGSAVGEKAAAAKEKVGSAAGVAASKVQGAGSTAAGVAANAASTAAGMAGTAADAASAKVEAAKQAAFEALPQEERELLVSAKEVMQTQKERAKNRVLNGTMPLGGKVLDLIKDSVIENATDDADMPAPVARSLRWLIDGIFYDLKVEARKGVRDRALTKVNDGDGARRAPCICTPWGFRAFILHHFLPHDRSIWGKLKDPVYLFLLLIVLFPRFAGRQCFFCGVLFLIAFPCPPDEYQLVNFVLQFKGSQYLTGGVLASLWAMIQSETCARRGFLCPALGPMPFTFGLLELLLNIVLCWTAFMMLPYSKKYGGSKFVAEKHLDEERLEKSLPTRIFCCCGVAFHEDRGGRLAYLLRYDACCVAVCAILFVLLTWLWESKEMALFWIETLHAFMSVPFALFMLPGLQRLLTHTEPTGYDVAGKCVELQFRTIANKDGSKGKVLPQ